MNFENTEQCCKQRAIVIIEYDLGSLGTKKFRVCKKHRRQANWNSHIVSQVELGESID